ncbi:MAG: GGDEF domain-containing protein [Clostridium sp.]|uniref:GGDEF domain-containing protein n=1 Tax=Clostridium sp. TaxID=1506 RepID=UPI0025C50B5D|nr:GGDEF domain-containing protein [Clostridium sp.]MCF0149312.1 GGDEF domain-containing protein [Clostridium sp.]
MKSVAEVIKSVVKREGDLVARFGGEEFIVMLSNTTEKDALVIAESMRVQVERLAIKNEKIDSVITISLGVAVTIPDIYIKPYDLINRADKLLYKGKESGRNKVIS